MNTELYKSLIYRGFDGGERDSNPRRVSNPSDISSLNQSVLYGTLQESEPLIDEKEVSSLDEKQIRALLSDTLGRNDSVIADTPLELGSHLPSNHKRMFQFISIPLHSSVLASGNGIIF